MNTFKVAFHKEDRMDEMVVRKLSDADFEKETGGGIRQLFELDTNIGFFIFADAESHDGKESYLALRYEEDEDTPSDIYGFELKDFYEFSALFLSQMYYDDGEDEEEDEYGPVHHLAHLIYHIYEAGQDANP